MFRIQESLFQNHISQGRNNISPTEKTPNNNVQKEIFIFKNRLKNIDNYAKNTDYYRPLDKMEQKVVNMGFVTKSHLIAISVAAKKGNFAVSIRNTGVNSLEWLDKGSATKPHSILEKTLKSSRLKPDMRQIIKDNGLLGLAAHWNGETPIGLFITNSFYNQWKHLLKSDGNGNFYLPIDFLNPQDKNLAILKSTANWEKAVITGDYDLHDMISFTGRRHSVHNGSYEETFICQAINGAIEQTQPSCLGKANINNEYQLVQHGPQVNYPMFIKNNEPKLYQKLVPTIALPSILCKKDMVIDGTFSPSLALCNRGKWSIIRSLEELRLFYIKQGTNIKETWQLRNDQTICFDKIGATGFGLTRRRSCV